MTRPTQPAKTRDDAADQKKKELRIKAKEKWAEFRDEVERANLITCCRISQAMITDEDLALVEQLKAQMAKVNQSLSIAVRTFVKRGTLTLPPEPRKAGFVSTDELPCRKGDES